MGGALREIIGSDFASFVGRTGFEELARQTLVRLGDDHRLPFVPESVGRLWGREVEVDVVALERRTRSVLLGECRWTSRKVGPAVLEELLRRAESLPRLKDYKKHFALFSKSGFTDSVAKRARDENVLLFPGGSLEQVG